MIIAPKSTVVILDSNILIIEEGVAVYNPAATYVTYDVVQVNAPTHRKYEAFKDVPAGIDPVVDVNQTTGKGKYWFDAGSTNYGKAFDDFSSSRCENAEFIYYKFQTSDVDLLMLSGLVAATVRIKIVNLDAPLIPLMDETFITQEREVFDWSDWTTAVPEHHSSFFKTLKMAYNTTMEIWINNPESIASIGHIPFGRSKDYGLTLYEPKPVSSRRGITSKTRNADGSIVVRRKARYRRMKVTCSIPENFIDIIEDRLEAIVDTPCIFVGNERDGGHKALLIYGEMRDHDMPISRVSTSYQLEIEGYPQ